MFLQNIAINLRATGPAAVLITWLLCITALGLFGSGSSTTGIALGGLFGIGITLIGALAQSVK
jgi:hypothetical protein